MRCASIILAAAGTVAATGYSGVTGKLGDAAVITNNPAGAVYAATLPNREDTPVRGSVVASTVGGGEGVEFQVSISGLPAEGGPFLYHIHDQPVPESGNCTETLAHLDPYERGEDPVCDSTQPQTCQVGDNSGKHGKMQSPGHSQTYQDKYAALVPGIGAFFGNRSIVIHFANKTRITCANFQKVAEGAVGPGTAPYPTGTVSVVGTGTAVPYGNVSTPVGGIPGTPIATPPTTPVGTPSETTTPLPSSGAMRNTLSGAAAIAAFAAALL